MKPISRRNVLLLGGLGAASLLVGGVGFISGWTANFDTASGQSLVEPKSFRRARGQLRVELAAAEEPVRIAGRQATALAYNGVLPGPSLFVRPGDLLRVTLKNRLNAATNRPRPGQLPRRRPSHLSRRQERRRDNRADTRAGAAGIPRPAHGVGHPCAGN